MLHTCPAERRNRAAIDRSPEHHFVYIVRCADRTLYTGYARDPAQRVAAHNAGRGAHYTACRRPVALVYAEAFGSKSDALKRECQLKRWSKAKKERLVARPATVGTAG